MFDEELLRSYLRNAQSRGEYDGFPEEEFDFDDIPRTELEYYMEWVDEETIKEWGVFTV